MIEKTKIVYESTEELKEARAAGALKAGDQFLTKDIDGEALFDIADVRKKKIILCRKYLLKNCAGMGTEGELLTWLDEDYYSSLPKEVQDNMKSRGDSMIFLPREVEVFGEHIYSDEAEKGRQWELFKNVKKRIKCHSKGDERSDWYWLSSPNVSNSTAFCSVGTSGAASNYGASNSNGVAPCFIIAV